MSKADLITKINRSLVSKKIELDILRRGRSDEVRKWERLVIDLQQRLLQLVRDMRESGLEKLSKISYNQLAKLTQNQTLLQGYYARALMADEEQTKQLLVEFETDTKLSENNPILLCPQVLVNCDDILHSVINPEIKTELVQVSRPPAIDLESQTYLPISFSLIESSKWQLPVVIGCHSDKGTELMNQLLFPFRSQSDLERTYPTQTKWNFGMTPFNESFSRVSFRIYDREDETLNRVLVIFLDDAKRQPRWTRIDHKFYRIPAEFNFSRYPAYTYHIWLTDKENDWSQYGSSQIPLEKRNQIREFIGKYKTYDATVPDVNCTVLMKSSRGKHEPWAYEGDIFLATNKDDEDARNSTSLASFIATLQTKEIAEPETEEEIVVDDEISNEKSSQLDTLEPTSSCEVIDEVEKGSDGIASETRPKSYYMDPEERWRNISAIGKGGAHEYEDEFWPQGATFQKSLVIKQYMAELGIAKKLEEHIHNENLEKYLAHIFKSAPAIAYSNESKQVESAGSGNSQSECDSDITSTSDLLDQLFREPPNTLEVCHPTYTKRENAKQQRTALINHYEGLLAAEIIIWQVNGKDSLRERLLKIESVQHPAFADFYEAFGLPCLYRNAFGLLNELRYDQIPNRSSDSVDSAYEEFEDDEEEIIPISWKPTSYGIMDVEYCRLPDAWPSLFEDEIEEVPNMTAVSNESFSSSPQCKTSENVGFIKEFNSTENPSDSSDTPDVLTEQDNTNSIEHLSDTTPEKETSSEQELPAVNTWEVYGKSVNKAKSPELIHGRVPKFGEDFKPRPYAGHQRRNTNRSPDEVGFKTKNKKPQRENSFQKPNPNFGHRRENQLQESEREVFLVKPDKSRFPCNGGFGSTNGYRGFRQNKIQRKSSVESTGNNFGSKRHLPPPANPKRVFGCPGGFSGGFGGRSGGDISVQTTVGWNGDNSKAKKKVPPAPPRLDSNLTSGSQMTNTLHAPEPFQKALSRPKRFSECKTDGEDFHTTRTRKYRSRREPFQGDESSNSSQDLPVEYGDLQPGEGTNGMFSAADCSMQKDPHVQISNTSAQAVASLPRPSWKKTQDDSLFALIKGISKWRQSEVKQLFEFCEPREVRPAGRDWKLLFNDKDNLTTSRMINGTELKKGGVIEVDINPTLNY